MKATLMAIRRMTDGEPGAAPVPSNVLRGGISTLARRGKSATSRAAIVPGSRPADASSGDGPSGSASINEANRLVAVAAGNPANSAASCQGSMSSRANAERTLSSMPFLSSPIGANRKSSNSGASGEIEAECVIATTEPCRFHRTPKPTMKPGRGALAATVFKSCESYFNAARRIRLGNYLDRTLSRTDTITSTSAAPCLT